MDEDFLSKGMRLSYSRAKLFESFAFIGSVGTLFISIALLIIKTEPLLTWLVLSIFLLRISNFLMNRFRSDWASLGHKIHHLNIFHVGLGDLPPPKIISEIQIAFEKQLALPLRVVGSYFATQSNIGPIRLVEAVTESSFHTSYLSRYSKRCHLIPIFFPILLIACGLYGVTFSLDQITYGRIVAAIASFVVLGDFTNRFLDFRNHEQKTQQIFIQGCELLKNPDAIIIDQAKDFAYSYLLTIPGSPLIPDKIYHWFGERIDRAWKKTIVSCGI